ncbi:MAG: hypothetical protein EXR36_13445 [Betaproteobacteria bacterium]|nr:hypothetical protein [Betaproteobacteria bacterium]
MERERVLQILKTLADGTDPGSGERFPANSPYQQPDVIRSLFWTVRELERHSGNTPAKASATSEVSVEAAPTKLRRNPNAGKPWSAEEDARLTTAFDAGRTAEQLASDHKRSRIAIEARLAKFGKMAAPAYLPSRSKPPLAESPMALYA